MYVRSFEMGFFKYGVVDTQVKVMLVLNSAPKSTKSSSPSGEKKITIKLNVRYFYVVIGNMVTTVPIWLLSTTYLFLLFGILLRLYISFP